MSEPDETHSLMIVMTVVMRILVMVVFDGDTLGYEVNELNEIVIQYQIKDQISIKTLIMFQVLLLQR